MLNHVFFSPTIKYLYKHTDVQNTDTNNQSIYIRSPFDDFLQQLNQSIDKMLSAWENQQMEQAIYRKKHSFSLGNLYQSLNELQRNVEVLSRDQNEFFDYIKRKSNENENEVEKLITPFVPLNMGDRITITEPNGKSASGVFIEFAENSIVWVNDSTKRLSMTSMKGLIFHKE